MEMSAGANYQSTTPLDAPVATGAPAELSATARAKVALAWSSYWIIMGVSFGLTAWLARRTPYAWYIMAQANVVMVMVFEEVIPKKRGDSVFRDGQSWNDLAHMLLYKLVCRPLIWAAALALVSFVGSRWPHTGDLWPSRLPVPAQFLLLWLVFDL